MNRAQYCDRFVNRKVVIFEPRSDCVELQWHCGEGRSVQLRGFTERSESDADEISSFSLGLQLEESNL
jgi:hypothetical protein